MVNEHNLFCNITTYNHKQIKTCKQKSWDFFNNQFVTEVHFKHHTTVNTINQNSNKTNRTNNLFDYSQHQHT